MRYYIVNRRIDETVVALLFHDPSNSYYFIKSKSEVFRRSFEASAKRTDLSFTRNSISISYNLLDVSKPFWSKKALDKACGSNWYVSETEDMDLLVTVDDIIDKHLEL